MRTTRATATHKGWTMHVSWTLEGTYLRVEPESAGGWIVVDTRRPERSLRVLLNAKHARDEAERMAAAAPEKWRI